MPAEHLTELAKRGLQLYEEKLKPILEPQYNSQFVAIHVPTSDYFIGRTSGDAMRGILRQHPVDGQVVIRKVGPEPEYGLAARVLAGELMATAEGGLVAVEPM